MANGHIDRRTSHMTRWKSKSIGEINSCLQSTSKDILNVKIIKHLAPISKSTQLMPKANLLAARTMSHHGLDVSEGLKGKPPLDGQ